MAEDKAQRKEVDKAASLKRQGQLAEHTDPEQNFCTESKLACRSIASGLRAKTIRVDLLFQ